MDIRIQHGFTLWELLMTLLVAGILLGLGVPNVMELQRNGAMTAAANELVTAVLMARTEAVKRQAPVGWCLTDNPMAGTPACAPGSVANSASRGFIVWVDDNNNGVVEATDGNAVVNAGEPIVRRSAAPGGRVRTSASCGYALFAPSGVLRQIGTFCLPNAPAPANARVVFFCDDRGRRASSGNLSSARAVRIDPVGRANAFSELADVNARFAAVSPIGATCALPPP